MLTATPWAGIDPSMQGVSIFFLREQPLRLERSAQGTKGVIYKLAIPFLQCERCVPFAYAAFTPIAA